jgi:hypothetical protein
MSIQHGQPLNQISTSQAERNRVAARLSIMGGALTVFVVVILTTMIRPNHPYVILMLALPLLGGVLCLVRPYDWKVRLPAVLLILFGSVQLLISGVGFWFLPSCVWLSVAAWYSRPVR